MAQDDSRVGEGRKEASVTDVKTYMLFIPVSICVVLTFAMVQHLLVLGIPLRDIRLPWLIVPATVGGLFGFLLAKVRILHRRSRHRLDLISERDRLLQQEIAMRKAVEESLRDQQARLELANEELKAFSYSVSHDLRSPLRSISGFSDALAEECGEGMHAETRHYVERIQSACRRMEEMIDSLLALSRVSSAEVVSAPVNLSEMAEVVLGEFAEQEPGRRVAVEVQPGILVDGDPGLLRLVMDNLLGNAWKFTASNPAAAIRVSAATLEGRAACCIEDNGAGFAPEFADKLFTPFKRLHRREDYPGTGIGLATVQRALARQGGRIRAEGREGQGARFVFSL